MGICASILLAACVTLTHPVYAGTATAAHSNVIEPRGVQGMAACDRDFRQCTVWTASPRSADDAERWVVLHPELRHCKRWGVPTLSQATTSE